MTPRLLAAAVLAATAFATVTALAWVGVSRQTVLSGEGILSEIPVLRSGPRPRLMSGSDEPTFVGVLIPEGVVEVNAELGGRLQELRVKLGDTVDAGAVLAVLDGTATRLETAAAQATVRARAADADRAKAELELLEQKELSASTLVSGGYLSGEELAERQAATRAARSGREQAEATLAAEEARAKLVTGRVRHIELRAPRRGVITAQYLEVGSFVQVGTPLLRMVTDRIERVRFAATERDAHQVVPGSCLAVQLPGGARTVGAQVTSLSPELDRASGQLIGEARLAIGLSPLDASIGARVGLSPAGISCSAAVKRNEH